MASAGGNIKVVVRVRPFNNRELDRKAKNVVRMQGTQTVLTPPSSIDPKSKAAKAALDGAKTFKFDKSYWSFDRNDPHYAGQEDLFDDLGKPLLDNAFQGYNNCIFAYGQTGSGKSYSMMGYGEDSGVIPKICREMFERIDGVQQDKHLNCTVEVSYLEIYNERVRDLLNPATKGNLRVREHPSTGPYVEDLAKLAVRSFQEIENLMDEGNKARTVAATNMNETSSRSHAVFTLTLTQKRHDAETRMDTEKVAKISLVDLAGSERANSTGATGARLKEGAEINRSLSTLGRVIAALADLSSGKKASKGSMVPYRDSILTWLLKDSLGGNSLTAMIAAISPADINFEETLSTLRYADSAKRIKNHAVVNEDPNARMIRELKEELAQLRSKLSGGAVGGVAVPVEEQYAPDTPLDKQFVSITQVDGSVKKVSKAEIAEQLSQSEKLYTDLNQTWEEKLLKTEHIHKEREAALEELGISIEKGFVGLSTPKKMPHLVNLSDDPLLAECLVYNLKPGMTIVGNVDIPQSTADIRLPGSQILAEHCTFDNVDGAVTIVPKEGAAVMVNGQRIDAPKRLRSGYRIILGDFHIFRFNHPQEARAERAEQGSSLRYSITASQLGSPSPNGRSGHERSYSSVSNRNGDGSDFGTESPRPDSPYIFPGRGRDSDWSFARREAVSAVLGSDQKISDLADDELDILFEDLQRMRANRKKNGAENRAQMDGEDDLSSDTSYPVREKYASTGTIDNFSLDTVLTIPSTPQAHEEDERLRSVREELQQQLDKQREEYQAKLKSAEEANVEIEEIKAEKAKMEESLQHAKEEMQEKLREEKADLEKQWQTQKEEYERQIQELKKPEPLSNPYREPISDAMQHSIDTAKKVLARWQQRRYVSMAETVMQNAATLKEAQVMSQILDKNVVFQFCIVDVGHTFASSYDLVLNEISTDDDEDLDLATKPCVAVRVLDFKNCVIHIWSLTKLRKRLRAMRQLRQYASEEAYAEHFRKENPFEEACMPAYSRIGDVDVPLAAVFEAKVQDFSLDVISPYTTNVIGIVRVSLEPSSAEAPSNMLKFNVVMHDLVGIPEREGTEVHAQIFVPGISDEEGGATTTQMIKDFDEGPVRFESVHSMSLPLSSPRSACLRIAIFARVTPIHMDKLLSWDDMRDSAPRPTSKRHNSRLPESEFYSEEKHDVFARAQIHEISEDGTYKPVEVIQSTGQEGGAFQLHQGLQRRIVLNLTHTSRETMKWRDVNALRIGRVRLVDPSGKVSDPDSESPRREVPLKILQPATIKENADGTCDVCVIGQWDSSMHGSVLLDRATAERYRVQVTFFWNVTSRRLYSPMPFSINLALQIRPRTYIRPSGLLMQLWSGTRVVHSTTGLFAITVRPTSAKRAGDLWRMNTKEEYVKGEEYLSGWCPRGPSLIQDYISLRRRRARLAEIEAVKGLFSAKQLMIAPINGTGATARAEPDEPQLTARQEILLKKILGWWTARSDLSVSLLNPANLEPPRQGAAFASSGPTTPSKPHKSSPSTNGRSPSNPTPSPSSPTLLATVRPIPKNPQCLKSGHLFVPSPDAFLTLTSSAPSSPTSHQKRWLRRYVELRRPYLHLYTAQDGDELFAIDLTACRIDHEPSVARLLSRRAAAGSATSTPVRGLADGMEMDSTVRACFAVYAPQNTYVFACGRGEREKVEWILALDRGYFSGSSSSGAGTPV
ncbi:kinesin-domain-containing protein [Eremomyces bilateralis CBS 781.70]|uniref:Kinesin-domain-containing protein n=1 Tax=Eremomyces bilateralis CBS 781.70 TaxID=1392243 RepID=A0A6G1FS79_9PEZI|nr:kinesin-domain-containing protein [Eremomyces bilateralis CBS 781.70]KAF1808637.1 kinesin-domain-containing protein [Eremomyces bilateralis CBS 781.70]